MRTREELAWAAGFFDGEGCTSAQKYSATLSVAQNASNVEVLHRFRAALGFGTLYGPYKNSARGDVSVRFHVTSFEQVQAAMAMMWHWLGTAKRAQYIRVFNKTYVFNRRRGGNHPVHRAIRDARERGASAFVIWSPLHLNLNVKKFVPGRTTRLIEPPRLRARTLA